MESPQLENGYTRVANEILEALAMTNLNGTQRRILDVVMRQTYGYQRKEHELSVSFIAKATNINKRQIQRELSDLTEKNIILIKQEATFDESRVLEFNKNYKGWSISQEVTKKTPDDIIDTHTGDKLDITGGDELDTQIKKKENIKEIYNYYLSLNLIKHRTYTEDMTKAIKKAMKNNKYTIEYCKILLERHEKVVEVTKNSPYPVKVRGLSEYFGQKVFNATNLICSEYEEGGKYYEQYLKEDKLKVVREPLKLIIRDYY